MAYSSLSVVNGRNGRPSTNTRNNAPGRAQIDSLLYRLAPWGWARDASFDAFLNAGSAWLGMAELIR